MKKTFIALAIAAASISAHAQVTGIVEYDYDRVSNTTQHSNYVASGLIFSTKYGNFDAYAQGLSAYSDGNRDTAGGVEVGYSNQFSVGSVGITPRIAFGTLEGLRATSVVKYMLYSVEVSTLIAPKTTGFIGVSHMNGLTQSAISAQNRVLIGADYALTERLSARIAYSHKRYLQQNANGIMTSLAYYF